MLIDMTGKRTPEELRQFRIENLAKARAAKKAKPQQQESKLENSTSLPSQEFAGLTARDCPAACRQGHCVITRDGHCGHPRKGGIQGLHHLNQDIVDRFHRAKKALAHVEVDRRP